MASSLEKTPTFAAVIAEDTIFDARSHNLHPVHGCTAGCSSSHTSTRQIFECHRLWDLLVEAYPGYGRHIAAAWNTASFDKPFVVAAIGTVGETDRSSSH